MILLHGQDRPYKSAVNAISTIPAPRTRLRNTALFFVSELLMNSPDLLLHIDVLDHVIPLVSLFYRGTIVAICGLLSSGCLLFRDWLACYTIKQIAPLTCEPLEIVGHILG
jgi:hypothetical protein